MKGIVSRIDGVVARWVNPDVAAEVERNGQIVVFRLLVVATAAILLLLPPLLAIGFALPLVVAASAVAAAEPLIVAAVLCASGSRRMAGLASLALATGTIGALAAVSGGLASPFVGWLALLPLATAIAGRNWIWFALGVAAAFIAGAGAAIAGSSGEFGQGLVLAAILPVAGVGAYGLARLSIAFETMRAGSSQPAGAPAEAMFAHLPGLVTIHDLRGHVLSVHGAQAGAFARWMNPLDRGFFQQIHVGDRLAFMQAIDEIRRGSRTSSVTLRMHAPSMDRAGDRLLHIASDLVAMHGADGQLERILVQSRDMSEAVQGESEMAARIDAAENANVAKTRFLAAVSHELRTPLNAIIGFSETLGGEYFGGFESEKQREYVGLINQSGVHLLSLVNSLLDLSRIEAGRYDLRYEAFGVGEAVRRCEAMLAGQAEAKGVLLTSRIGRDCGSVTADARAFDQILINLVANAVKFTEKGGVVTLDAERRSDRLRVSVSDTGIGISAEHLDVIGEPFTQVSQAHACSGEGSGLGLSLVKGLVGLHRGGFTIRSTVGEGTVVTIELPCEGRPETADSSAAAEPAVVFPPHLPAAGGWKKKEETDGYDDAKAQTA